MNKFQQFPVQIEYNPGVYNRTYITFACLSEEGQLTATPSICKEYVLDHVNFAINGHKPYYLNSYHPAALAEIRIFVSNCNYVDKSIDLINKFEDRIEIPRSIVNESGQHHVFRGSPRWLIAPPMTSLYTFLIRRGYAHEIGESIEKALTFEVASEYYADTTILQYGLKGINHILNYGDREIFGEQKEANWFSSDMHDWGISTFANRHYAMLNLAPNWFKNFKEN